MKRDSFFKNARPADKDYKLTDWGGLFLLVRKTGGKLWQMAYRAEGKQKTLSFGAYPAVSLEQARRKRDEARALIAEGQDPGEVKKEQRAAQRKTQTNTFEAVAREFFEIKINEWSESHHTRSFQRLKRNVFPFIGHIPISELTVKDYLAVFRAIESRGTLETARRTREICGQVQRYAIATDRAVNDPVSGLKGVLKTPIKQHFAAIIKPLHVGELLRLIEGYHGNFITKSALQLAAYTFVRPGELREAKWEDIDLEDRQWRFLSLKTKVPHIVPLASQVVAILEELKQLTGHGTYVFPSVMGKNKPMSDMTLNGALRRLGISNKEHTGHGFRAMARTLLDEVLGERVDLIEHQLAHVVRDPHGRAYNRTTHLPARTKMMQRWADYLDQLRDGKEKKIRK